jgi:alanyl-tRNA synthetase
MEYKQLQADFIALKEKNDEYVAQELLSKQEGRFLTYIFEDKSLKDLQNLAIKLTADNELQVLFATTVENKVVMAHNGSFDHSCGTFFKANLGSFQGKGGGSEKIAQAGFPTWEDASAFYEFTRKSFQP